MLTVVPFIVGVLLSADPAGTIAFVTGTEQEDQCVCLLTLPDKAIRRLGPGTRDGAPVWSPDGSSLAFESARPEGGLGIYVINADGTNGRFLAHKKEWNRGPSWSLDSRFLAYASGDAFNQRIMVSELATGVETQWGGDAIALMQPVWFSDEKLIAVGVVGVPGKQTTDLYWVSKDAAKHANETQASKGEYVEWSPAVYPKQGAVAYDSNDGGDREVFVSITRQSLVGFGTVVIDVSNNRAPDWNPVWSPDADWVAFESFRNGRRGVYRVNPLRALAYDVASEPEWDNWAPTWSPDSHWIAFVSNRTGVPHLYATHIGEASVLPLTDHATNDYAPAWRPDPSKKGK
ncbi:MAG: hypothetical protein WC655_01810 [Candidatus Hydrogenedentales bacterium]|jgi:Tol biopolymer transport system component